MSNPTADPATTELLLWPNAPVVYLEDLAVDVATTTLDATLDATRTGGPVIIAASLDELISRWATAHVVVIDTFAAVAVARRLDEDTPERQGATVLVYQGPVNTMTRGHWDMRDAARVTHGIRLFGEHAASARAELVTFLADQPDADAEQAS